MNVRMTMVLGNDGGASASKVIDMPCTPAVGMMIDDVSWKCVWTIKSASFCTGDGMVAAHLGVDDG